MKFTHIKKKLALLLTTMLFSPAVAAAQTTGSTQSEDVPANESSIEPVSTDEVVVLGRFIPEPMRATSEVVSVLTSEDLARTGDDNAALALTRLSGLSVVSGRFVFVRGLGDRYSSALLNGSPLPSPEPLRRQVPLDLFPSNILDGASVQKTFSPNYPGEFGGGIIDLRTLRMPNEPFLTLKAATGGNTESTDKSGFTYYGEQSDWTGISDGLRDVPGPLAAAIGRNLRIDDSNFTPAQLETIGESLVNSPFNVIQRVPLDPDIEGEVTAGASFDFGKYNLGLVGVVGYDSTWRTRRAHRTEAVGGVVEADYDTTTTTGDFVFNAFSSASLGWDDNEITLSGLLIRSTTKYAQVEYGFDQDLPGADPANPIDNELVEGTAWYERQLASIQIAGEHSIGNLELDWRGAFAQSTRDAPYERTIRYDIISNQTVFGGGGGLGNRIRFSELKDEVTSGGVDASYTISLTDKRDAVLSAGAYYANTVRNSELFQFAFTGPRGLTPLDVLTARVDYLLSPDNIDPQRFVLNEFTGQDDSYAGRLTNTAYYVAADVEVLPLVRVALGARFEDATQIVRTYNRFGIVPTAPVRLENEYLLPAATLTWNFAEDMQLRVGYSQTIARPQFRELARTPFVDPDTDRVYEGNPYLKDTEFKNFDARLEYYLGRNQFVTAGLFYKEVTNPIEEVVIRVDRYQTRFINAPEAQLQGVELEYRTRFELPFELPLLKGAEWLFSLNYTYTGSEVKAGPGSTVISPIDFAVVPSSFFELDGSKLQGTPENIVNLQFGFETEHQQLTLMAGWVDERILRRGQGSVEPVIEDPGVNLDLVYKYNFSIGGSDMTLGLSGRNLLQTEYSEYQNTPGLGRTDVNTYDRGASYSVSLTAKF